MIKISYSRVSCYLSCPYMHYLRYVECLRKKEKSRPLSFGTDFHKLLEHRGDKSKLKLSYDKIKEKYYDLSPKHQLELGESYLEDLKTVFSDYQKVYKTDTLPDKTEVSFDLPIGKYRGESVIFTGIIDEIYETEDGLLIGEHKTFTRRPDMLFIVMNTQKCLYAKAIQLLTGSFPLRVIWDYIKSTPAKEPIWLEKSGKFSEAKNDNITPYSWMRACKKRGIKDKEILDKATNYSGNIVNFYFRISEDYVSNMVENIYNDFVYTAKDIVKQGHKNVSKHIGANCSWCDYKQVCYAELTDGNVDYVKEKDFEVG